MSDGETHGPMSAEQLNVELERVERETLAKTNGQRHGAVAVMTPSGRMLVVDCKRRTAVELAEMDRAL
jgi:hypothetical protein